jgi:hypothetical protein
MAWSPSTAAAPARSPSTRRTPSCPPYIRTAALRNGTKGKFDDDRERSFADRGLPDQTREPRSALDGLGCGLQSGHDLDQPHQRHWRDEVEAEHALGSLSLQHEGAMAIELRRGLEPETVGFIGSTSAGEVRAAG